MHDQADASAKCVLLMPPSACSISVSRKSTPDSPPQGQLLFAKAKYISGELETAQHTINNCIRLDPTFAEAHLVAAQIAYQQDNFAAASQSLQQALSLDFEVRDWPQYNLLKAHVYTSQGDFDEALVVLEHALGLAKASKGGGVLAVAPVRRRGGRGGGLIWGLWPGGGRGLAQALGI